MDQAVCWMETESNHCWETTAWRSKNYNNFQSPTVRPVFSCLHSWYSIPELSITPPYGSDYQRPVSALDLILLHYHRSEMHISKQNYYIFQDTRQMTKKFSASSVYFLQVEVPLSRWHWWGIFLIILLQACGLDEAKFCKTAEASSTHNRGHLKSICRLNHFALGSLLLCLGSLLTAHTSLPALKKDLQYTSVNGTCTTDCIPVLHNIHLLRKPTEQLVTRYFKGHNATFAQSLNAKPMEGFL